MKIIPIIESQINNILILGYEPAAIQLHEEIFDTFIEECKSFITTAEDKPAIDFNVARFMGLPILCFITLFRLFVFINENFLSLALGTNLIMVMFSLFITTVLFSSKDLCFSIKFVILSYSM